MIPGITRDGMIEVDRIMVQDLSIEVELMMEHAGVNLAKVAIEHIVNDSNLDKVLVVVGTGNNGGGGLVAARRIHNWGFPVLVYLPRGIPTREIPQIQYERAKNCGVEMVFKVPELLKKNTLIIDAYIGYNFRGELTEVATKIVSFMSKHPLISLDIPSGVDSNSGMNKGGLEPLATVTLAWPKIGMLNLRKNTLGMVFLADIGIPNWVYENPDLFEVPPKLSQIQNLSKKFTRQSVIQIEIENNYWKIK